MRRYFLPIKPLSGELFLLPFHESEGRGRATDLRYARPTEVQIPSSHKVKGTGTCVCPRYQWHSSRLPEATIVGLTGKERNSMIEDEFIAAAELDIDVTG